MSSKRSAVLAGLALAVTSLAAAAPAAASAATPRPAHELTALSGAGPGGPLIPVGARGTSTTSFNWSGYALTGGTYTTVSAHWIQPRADCASGTGIAGFWVGLDGDGNSTVEQTGDTDVCNGSSASYYAWYEMFPARAHNYRNPVRPGDHMRAAVSYTGGGNFALRIIDVTQRWAHTAHGSLGSAQRASAEVIIEAPCCNSQGNPMPLAHFARVPFAGVSADGVRIGALHPTKIIMIDQAGHHLDAITNLSGGNHFTATWLRKS